MSDEKQYHAALQRIGTALGLPAGSDLTKACVPAIEALKASALSVGEPVAWQVKINGKWTPATRFEADEAVRLYRAEVRGLGVIATPPAAQKRCLLGCHEKGQCAADTQGTPSRCRIHPRPTPVVDVCYVISWRYSDGSKGGAVCVHHDKTRAESMLEMLKEHGDARCFRMETAPYDTLEKP